MQIYFSYRKCKLADNRNNTLSMSTIMCLNIMDYLTDEVNTMCILYGQSEKMISNKQMTQTNCKTSLQLHQYKKHNGLSHHKVLQILLTQ